jgi:hypothetical protein
MSERFRRFLTEAAIAHRLLMVEHQIGSARLTIKQADNHRRGFAPPGTPPDDSRRTHIPTLPMCFQLPARAREAVIVDSRQRLDLPMVWNHGGQAQIKSCAAPRGADRPQAPTMRLND